ncbi:hypothetical protein [Flavobacterium sp.]|uniref:hypothetical protein n=1 Tax=Flavobacterium sp. TaxID=239 RepID=UPI003D6C663E
MGSKIRREEYTTLGDFILPNFRRDQAAIAVHYPKLNVTYLAAFMAKLEFVKELESKLVLNEQQKNATRNLYELANEINSSLNYLSSYLKDAGLNNGLITELKTELHKRNIEGAILKMEAIKQYVATYQGVLEVEGMPSNYVDVLTGYKLQLETGNTLQNQFMDKMKQLTETNTAHYEELYKYIANIARKGKLVFKDTVRQEEYTLSKNIGRMRASAQRNTQTQDTDAV